MNHLQTESAELPTQRLQDAWNWLDSQQGRMQQTLIRWCGQTSWSQDPQGLFAMADLLAHDFEPLGLDAHRRTLPPLVIRATRGVELEQLTGPGLLWHHRSQAPRRVLMMIHYDTVYPPLANTSDGAMAVPACYVEGQRLIGPGVADAKGGIAVIRFAAEALLRFEIGGELGWSIALNPDEEIGSPSSAAWLAELAPQFDFALVFEPALPDGAMVANRKGTSNWRFTVGGRSAHAGRNPEQGRNALVHAARLAVELDQLNDHRAGVTVNVGRFESGVALNQVPDMAWVDLNVRVVDAGQAELIESQLRGLAQRYDQLDGYSCKLDGRFHSPPKRIDDSYGQLHRQYHQAAELLGRQVQWRDTGGACDGSKLAAAGLINIDTMGPIGGHLHSPLEYCETGSLLTAAKTLVNLFAIAAAEQK